jgi:hypothetical protein
MKNKFKHLFAVCLLLTTCFSLFSSANSNSQIICNEDIVVTNGKDLKDLNSISESAKHAGWIVAWSSNISGLIAWDSGPDTPTTTK